MNIDTGVYLITNTSNHRVYVGGTSESFHKRWQSHKRELKKGLHPNKSLQTDWNLYGEESFVFSVLEEVRGIENISHREREWLSSLFDQKVYCYNATPYSVGVIKSKKENKGSGFRTTIFLKDDRTILELINWLKDVMDEENASRVVKESLKVAKAAKDAGVRPEDFIAGNYTVEKKK